MSRRFAWRGRASIVPAPFVAAAVLLATAAALGAAPHAAGDESPESSASGFLALPDTQRYCAGYETTFHGEWPKGEDGTAESPVLFRIGVNAGGKGCYAQLNVKTPPGIAPYELPRFQVEAGDGGEWTLRYRSFVFTVDPGRGTAVRIRGGEADQIGTLLEQPPPVREMLPAPSAERRSRWYGKWGGRISRQPFPVTLQFAESSSGEVEGRISMLLKKRDFIGRFHGEMLMFRWKNRHVGLVMEPDGDTLVYNDYRGRVYRFRRRE